MSPFLITLLITLLAISSAAVPRVQPAVTALAFTPDGKALLHGSQAGVFLRGEDGKDAHAFATELDHIHALVFSPDGAVLACAGGSPAESGGVELWSWPERKFLRRIEEHDDVVHAVAWLAQGKLLATAGVDRTVRIFDRGGRCLATLRGHSGPVLSLAASPDGKLLCSGSGDQTIRLWDTTDWKLVRSLNNHLGAVHALAFRPGWQPGQLAVLASAAEDGTVRIWQPDIGRMVRIVRHPAPVLGLAWGDDGGRLHSTAKDGNLRTIDGDSDQVLQTRKVAEGWLTTVAGRGEQLAVGDCRGAITVPVPQPAKSPSPR
jgi:WD40 repeat protein